MEFDVAAATRIVAQVRPSLTGHQVEDETFEVRLDGSPQASVEILDAEYGGRLDVVDSATGQLSIHYRATVAVIDDPQPLVPRHGSPALERLELARPSRYCPSDHVGGIAAAEFGAIDGAGAQAAAIASWIHDRIGYVAGSTDVHDSAEHTLLTGQGVCRDFAHLGILLCRALDIPARFAAVFAPGLDPMDFHAVFEAWHDDGWWVYDATRLAPRQSLVRIATGRDAADTSFATVIGGRATLTEMSVMATVDGELPTDDHASLVALG
ncbi:MAG: transglutaminase family protein [Frankiaceae bacterium]|nr:transglutaminase family protein [Frankiaceae bacterium]MBV9870947.1 transglutaminase family protein [Frankiaceae bacterium]